MGLQEDLDNMKNEQMQRVQQLTQQAAQQNAQKWSDQLGSKVMSYGPGGQFIMTGYQPAFTKDMMDTRGMDKLRQQTLSGSESMASRLMKQMNAQNAMSSREGAQQAGAAQASRSMDDLAAKGGLSSGARERVSRQGMTSGIAAAQDAARQENQSNLQVGIQDAQQKQGALQALPGMEIQAMQPMLQENQRQQQYKQWASDQNNKAQAAQISSDAQRNSGKK